LKRRGATGCCRDKEDRQERAGGLVPPTALLASDNRGEDDPERKHWSG